MFTTMKDRLQQFLNMEQLSPARLSDIIGIQRSGMSHILSGRNKPSFDFIQKLILKFPSLSSDWLITGKGKMYKDANTSVLQNSIFSETVHKTDNTPKPIEILQHTDEIHHSEPSEISIKQSIPVVDSKKKRLIKMILVYSDGTFNDFIPEDDIL